MVNTYYFSDRGGRDHNEDYVSVVKQDGYVFVIVADGLGGMGNGDVASKMVVQSIENSIYNLEKKEEVTPEKIQEWFDVANDAVYSAHTATNHMGSTLCVLCINEKAKKVIYAHVGDSRIYHFYGEDIIYCSFDHSVSRMSVVSGEISFEDIRFHADRSKLLRAMGKTDEVTAEIKDGRLDKKEYNSFLVCSDGFWEYVTEDEMVKTLLDSETTKEWFEKMMKYHQRKIKPGNDNFTAATVFII